MRGFGTIAAVAATFAVIAALGFVKPTAVKQAQIKTSTSVFADTAGLLRPFGKSRAVEMDDVEDSRHTDHQIVELRNELHMLYNAVYERMLPRVCSLSRGIAGDLQSNPNDWEGILVCNRGYHPISGFLVRSAGRAVISPQVDKGIGRAIVDVNVTDRATGEVTHLQFLFVKFAGEAMRFEKVAQHFDGPWI